MGIQVNAERTGDVLTLTVVIPPRRDSRGAHTSVMQRVIDCALAINLDAYDPEPVNPQVESGEVNSAVEIAHRDGHTADGGGVIPESLAIQRMRDEIPPDDDEVVFPRACATGGCDGD